MTLQERGEKRFRTLAHQRAGEAVAPEDVQQPVPETVSDARTLSPYPVAGAVVRVPLLLVPSAGDVRGRSAAAVVRDQPPRVRHIPGQRERVRHDALELQHVRHMASIA